MILLYGNRYKPWWRDPWPDIGYKMKVYGLRVSGSQQWLPLLFAIHKKIIQFSAYSQNRCLLSDRYDLCSCKGGKRLRIFTVATSTRVLLSPEADLRITGSLQDIYLIFT